MIENVIGYSYNDLTIVPAVISKVSSRSECNPFVKHTDSLAKNMLPIFTAPMASVVDFENYETFADNGITPIIPRNISLDVRKDLMNDQQWVALSLKEFEDLFITNAQDRQGESDTHYFICVDIANGHMKSLYSKCHQAKKLSIKNNYELTIMTGNIANPETYRWICDFNRVCKANVIDYIRVGIGGGSGCITTSNVSAHYPQASLVNECYIIKEELQNTYVEYQENFYDYKREKKYKDGLLPKIVADGGIRNYDHVIKALALGADYVMIGSLFAQCIESAGEKCNNDPHQKFKCRIPIERYGTFEIDSEGNWWGYYSRKYIDESLKPWEEYGEEDKLIRRKNYLQNEKKFIGHIDVKFFGMASADGQKSISGEKTKTAEGITKYLPVKYTINSWTKNMISYLRSAMSYTDCTELDEFIGKPSLIVNSISEIQAVNK